MFRNVVTGTMVVSFGLATYTMLKSGPTDTFVNLHSCSQALTNATVGSSSVAGAYLLNFSPFYGVEQNFFNVDASMVNLHDTKALG